MTAHAASKIYVLLGPTAAGKSAVAMEIARHCGCEIISMDSMQVYRGMDIGTAKPSPAEQREIPHHLIDLREPWEDFSTAEYVGLADAAISRVAANGGIALLVGGSALYLKSLLHGIVEGGKADWALRRRIRAEAARQGSPALHRRLAALDPARAARIHPNDLRRIERALEIHEKTGRPPSELARQWARAGSRYDAEMVGLDLPRALQMERINARVDRMLADGWLVEVRGLAGGAGLGRTASQALGYGELARVASGEIALEEAIERIKARTRQFAKRQMTWFRGFGASVEWLRVSEADRPDTLAVRVMDMLGLGKQRED